MLFCQTFIIRIASRIKSKRSEESVRSAENRRWTDKIRVVFVLFLRVFSITHTLSYSINDHRRLILFRLDDKRYISTLNLVTHIILLTLHFLWLAFTAVGCFCCGRGTVSFVNFVNVMWLNVVARTCTLHSLTHTHRGGSVLLRHIRNNIDINYDRSPIAPVFLLFIRLLSTTCTTKLIEVREKKQCETLSAASCLAAFNVHCMRPSRVFDAIK